MKFFLPFLIIAVCVGTYFLYIGPSITEVNDLLTERTRRNDVLERTRELAEIRDSLFVEYNSIPSEDIDKLNKIVPDTFNSIIFANDLSGIATASGVKIKDYKAMPLEPENREGIIEDTSGGHKTTKVSLKVTGQYTQFMEFLRSVERSLQLADVTNLSIKPTTSSNSQNQGQSNQNNTPVPGELEYLLEMNLYSLR